jgi:O-methyltransferase involved in polyketide biosynthesis
MTEDATARNSLAYTSRWAAAVRAYESQRPDALFNDPWAAALAGQEGAYWLQSRGSSVAPMIIRTCYFDDFLGRVIRLTGCPEEGGAPRMRISRAGGPLPEQPPAPEKGLRQVVILAAGLDTRAYRLTWPAGTCIYELDQPAVLLYKQHVLDDAGARPTCPRRAVTADLAGDWQEALLAQGFNPACPSLWLAEGFTFYLPDEAIARILQGVSALAAPGSRLGFDCVNHATLTSPLTHAWIEMQAREGAPWLGGLDDPEGFLGGLGWTVALTQPGAEDANYGRWTLPVIPVKMPDMPHNWYVTAEKR